MLYFPATSSWWKLLQLGGNVFKGQSSLYKFLVVYVIKRMEYLLRTEYVNKSTVSRNVTVSINVKHYPICNDKAESDV